MKPPEGAWLAFAVLLFGAFLLTVGHRLLQDQPAYSDVTDEKLDDRQRVLIEAQAETSTTLFNLAFAALVGLVSLQVYGKRAQRPTGTVPLVAAALLALSMYASFLFRTRVTFALGRGPLSLLVSPGVDFPLVAQFWLFAVSILLLLFWVFPSRGTVGIMLAVGSLSPGQATAQQTTVRQCTTVWMVDRHVTLPSDTLGLVERMAKALASEAAMTLEPASLCPFVESMLDELRRRVVSDGGADVENPSEALTEAIRLAAETFDSRNFSLGDAVSRLIAMAQVWNQASGLLVVRSTIGTLHVIVTPTSGEPRDWRGLTNWTVRLPAGIYRLEVMKEGFRVTPSRTFTLVNGQRLDLAFPEGAK